MHIPMQPNPIPNPDPKKSKSIMQTPQVYANQYKTNPTHRHARKAQQRTTQSKQ